MRLGEIRRQLRTPGSVTSRIRNELAHLRDSVAPGAFPRLYRRVRPYTLCSNARLRSLYDAVATVVRDGIEGDVVECGAARGGSAALLGLALAESGDRERLLWVFDTFRGLPAPSANDPDRELAQRHTGTCVGTRDEVVRLFDDLGLLDRSRLVEGRFEETLAAAPVQRISLLHVDCDWYDSVTACLEAFYDRVSVGGIVQLDDYGYWEGTRKAVDDFLGRRGLEVAALERIDHAGRRLVKQSS